MELRESRNGDLCDECHMIRVYRKNSAVYFNKTNNKEVRDSETSLSLTSLLIFNQLHFTSVIFTTTFNHSTLAALHRVPRIYPNSTSTSERATMRAVHERRSQGRLRQRPEASIVVAKDTILAWCRKVYA